MHFTRENINDLEKIKKDKFDQFMLWLYKSANLIGSVSKDGITNVAVFSSITHLGSNPPTSGFYFQTNYCS